MTFGEKLQDLRRRAGMSQDTLAERLEVSRQAVSKWERDEAMPETEKVVRVARLFQVSLDELLLDGDVRHEKQAQQSTAYTDMKRAVRRHGYKSGYVLTVLGLLICAQSLLMWLQWPGIGMGMLEPILPAQTSDFRNPYQGKSYTIIVGGEERVVTDIPEFMIEKAKEEQGVVNAEHSMGYVFENALRAQSKMFLIGLLPGGIMTGVGIAIVVMGKKLSGRENEG